MDPNKPECYTPSQSQSLQRTVQEEETEVDEQTEAAIMAAFDGTEGDKQFIVADTSRDDAWVSVDAEDCLPLEAWR